MGKGIFGGLFDFNHDGKMSSFEKAAELGFLHHIMESEKKDAATHTPSYGGSIFSSTADEDHDDLSLDLMVAGLDEFELSLMDDDARRTALEGAGLDPDDFDDEEVPDHADALPNQTLMDNLHLARNN